ncbi:MAG: hypothetical protein AAF354_13540 [Pseudomonadota bacterium]
MGGWLAVTGRFGAIQTRVLLTFFYFTLLGPVAVVATVAGRDLLDKHPRADEGTAWLDADASPPDLERAKLTS